MEIFDSDGDPTPTFAQIAEGLQGLNREAQQVQDEYKSWVERAQKFQQVARTMAKARPGLPGKDAIAPGRKIICQECGASVKSGKGFCTNCGRQAIAQTQKKTRTCPNCQTVNRSNVKFCTTCGHRLTLAVVLACPHCDASLKPGQKFCTSCGRHLTATPAYPSRAGRRPDAIPVSMNRSPSSKPAPATNAQRATASSLPAPTTPPPTPPPVIIYTVGPPPAQEKSVPAAAPQKGNAPLPPPPIPWPFRENTTQLAGQIMDLVNNAGLPAGGMVGQRFDRLIRAAMLDKDVYRRVAADASLQLES